MVFRKLGSRKRDFSTLKVTMAYFNAVSLVMTLLMTTKRLF